MILLNLNLEIYKGDKNIIKKKYLHSVRVDPMKQIFLFYKSEENKYYEIRDFEKLVSEISLFEYTANYDDVKGNIDFKLTANLNKIKISLLEREYNLMSLWNWSKPYFEKNIEVEEYEV